MHGFEREGIRIDRDGQLAQSHHPDRLGKSLSHAYITTDFCESQLELVTPPTPMLDDALHWLDEIQRYVVCAHEVDLIWPFSMPPCLPRDTDQISIAQFGTSARAQEKTTYRRGIDLRYGRRRLTISGAHYNFSLDESSLITELLEKYNYTIDGTPSDAWFHIVRNLYRKLPFFTYLFGASPAFDLSFQPTEPERFTSHKRSTLYAPHATSLRMSDIGYTSRIQDNLSLSYNSLEAHLRDLSFAISTCNPAYQTLSKTPADQLNPNYLQIENELYRPFRLQRQRAANEGLVDVLRKHGPGHLETRLLDIDPESPGGVDPYTAGMLHLAMIDCLSRPSPPLDSAEWKALQAAQRKVVWFGRKEGLTITVDGSPKSFHDEGKHDCDALLPLAERLDADQGTSFYQESLNKQHEKWDAPNRTPSGRHLIALLDGDREFVELGVELAARNTDLFRADDSDSEIQKTIESETQRSIMEHLALSSKDNLV